MSDLKTERLINLTMALLATQRLLTKNEILRSVAGYSGTQEAMERMFERDKDDLRTLGIEIAVEPLDSLFDDELGYRIYPSTYALEIPDLSPQELGLLSLAGNLWRNQFLSRSSLMAMRKLESLGIDVNTESISEHFTSIDSHHADFEQLWSAIADRRSLEFAYVTSGSQRRKLNPYGLGLYKGEWYLAGYEELKGEIRVFKVSRTQEIEVIGKKGSFEIPMDFDMGSVLATFQDGNDFSCTVRIQKGKAHSLRDLGQLESEGDWETYKLLFASEALALTQLMWHGADVVVLEPIQLREKIVANLRSHLQIEAAHG